MKAVSVFYINADLVVDKYYSDSEGLGSTIEEVLYYINAEVVDNNYYGLYWVGMICYIDKANV